MSWTFRRLITAFALGLTLASIAILGMALVAIYAQDRIAALKESEAANTAKLANHIENLIDLATLTESARLEDSPGLVFIVDSPCGQSRVTVSKNFSSHLAKAKIDPGFWVQGIELFQLCRKIDGTVVTQKEVHFLASNAQLTVPYLLVLIRVPNTPERLAMIALEGFRSATHNTLLLMQKDGKLVWAADGNDYLRGAMMDTGIHEEWLQKLSETWSALSEVELVHAGTEGLLTGVGLRGATLFSISYLPALYEKVWFAVSQIGLLSLGFLFLCLYFGMRVSEWLAQPVRDLMTATEKAGAGEFEFALTETGRILELNQAKRSFNLMGAKMRAMISETRQKAEYEKEFKLAQQVQKLLIPPLNSSFEDHQIVGLMRPAAFLGGDWWGAREIPRPGKRPLLLLCAGDATDHGVPPALIAATVKGAHFLLSEGLTAAATSEKGLDPAEILQMFHRVVFDSAKGSIGMTMFVAVCDPESGVLRAGNAAHPRPMLVTREKSHSIGEQGEVLGYKEEPVQVGISEHPWNPGDRLVLYSDGLIENFKGETNLFRLKDVSKISQSGKNLRARELYSRILTSFERATHEIPQADDVTLIVCERKEAFD